jgi:hypothetical protein
MSKGWRGLHLWPHPRRSCPRTWRGLKEEIFECKSPRRTWMEVEDDVRGSW